MMEDMGIDPEDAEETELPKQSWYTPEEGLDWVAKMSEHVRANPSSVKNMPGVLADLDECRVVLARAKEIGARWNLRVDF